MPSDLSTATPLTTKTIVMGAAGVITLITCPSWASKLTIYSSGSLKLSHEGADGAAMGADYFPISNGSLELNLKRLGVGSASFSPQIRLAGVAGGETVNLLVEA